MEDLSASVSNLAISSCDYLGIKGVCAQKTCRAVPTRCYAHRNAAQKRMCAGVSSAGDPCHVRVVDEDGALCSRCTKKKKAPALSD